MSMLNDHRRMAVEGALLLWRCDWQPGGIPSGLGCHRP